MRRLLGAALATVLLVACSGGGDDDADPTPTTKAGPTTTAVDRSGIALAGVPGSTTTSIPDKGTARIGGSVQGPDGLVPGATVRIERLVAGREVRTDVVTGPDGRFLLENVPGGRYRIRAFLAPALAQVEPEVAFLRDAEDHSFDLVVTEHSGLVARASVAPELPLLRRPVNLAAVLARVEVDADGIVRATPVPNVSVELAGLGRWVLRDDSAPSRPDDDDDGDEDDEATTSSTFGFSTTTTTRPAPSPFATTDAEGRVRFALTCQNPGNPGLYLRVPVRRAPSPPVTGPDGSTSSTSTTEPVVETESIDLTLPACVDPATTTTVPPPSTDAPTTTSQ